MFIDMCGTLIEPSILVCLIEFVSFSVRTLWNLFIVILIDILLNLLFPVYGVITLYTTCTVDYI